MVASDQTAGRQRILDQAQQLFLAHGYHGVSIRDIVHACGLSNAALYYHFGDKQSLFVEVLKNYVSVVTQQVQEAGSSKGSCRERLASMAEAHAQFMLKSRSELHTLIRDLMQCDSEEIRKLVPKAKGQIPSIFATVMEEGIADGEIRPVDAQRVSVLLLGMISSLTAHCTYGTVGETLIEDVDLAISTLFEGIGA